jgi:Gpi18-like mannosyltransferase
MRIFILIIISALFFRLVLAPVTFHQDLLSQANWGQYISQNGSKDFYSYNVWTFSWPNHPPLASLYYGFCYKVYLQLSSWLNHSVLILDRLGFSRGTYANFIESLDHLVSAEKPYNSGYFLSLKIFPIVFDILIGISIFFLAKFYKKKPYKYLLIYLFSPFTWYVSSLWGQTDQLSFYFAFVAFLLLIKTPVVAIILFFLAVSVKPTSLFLAPLFLFILVKAKVSIKKIVLGIIVCFVLNLLIFKSFTDANLFDFTRNILLPRIFDRPPRLTTNSYNFWHIFTLDKGLSNKTKFLFVPAIVWGGVFYFLINKIAFKVLKKINYQSVITAIFIVSFGSWLFLTDMLDRYSFAGLVSGLALLIFYPKLLRYWLGLSVICWLNLFRGWWFPSFLSPLKYLLTTNNYIAGLFLSLGNVLIYFSMLRVLLMENFWPKRVIKNKK